MKASLQIMGDLRGDQQNYANLLQETFNGIEYNQIGFSAYKNIRLLNYQLQLMLSRLRLLQDTLDQEQRDPS